MARQWFRPRPNWSEDQCNWCGGWGGSHKQYDANLQWGECSKCAGTGRFPPTGTKQPPSPPERYATSDED